MCLKGVIKIFGHLLTESRTNPKTGKFDLEENLFQNK